MVLPTALQHRAMSWYHHYLQHPGATRLEETLRAAMYWKGMQNTIRRYVKNCHKCQVNKRHQHKYGKVPTKLVIQSPWEALCVDLIQPYTLKGQDKTEIDFMCLTMTDPSTGGRNTSHSLRYPGAPGPFNTYNTTSALLRQIICND